MDHHKIGAFIAELRKEKGLTQKELAEKLGVSDKAVSRWETAKGLPDISILTSLCDALDINVNELLAGERIEENDYTRIAEENMVTLIVENQNEKKGNSKQLILGIVLWITTAIISLICLFEIHIQYILFIDIPSILILCLLAAASVIISGKKIWQEIIGFLKKIILPEGILVALASFVVVMNEVNSFDAMKACLSVAILPVMYSVLVYIVLAFIEARTVYEN